MKNISNQRVFLIVIVLLTLLNLGFVISVFMMHNRDDGLGRRGMRHRHFMMEEVGFTDGQMEQFKQYRQQFRNETMPLHRKLRELNRELVIESTSADPDTTKCFAISRQIGDVHAELKEMTSLHMMHVREIANPAQIDKLHELYLEMFDGELPRGGGRGRMNNYQ